MKKLERHNKILSIDEHVEIARAYKYRLCHDANLQSWIDDRIELAGLYSQAMQNVFVRLQGPCLDFFKSFLTRTEKVSTSSHARLSLFFGWC